LQHQLPLLSPSSLRSHLQLLLNKMTQMYSVQHVQCNVLILVNERQDVRNVEYDSGKKKIMIDGILVPLTLFALNNQQRSLQNEKF
jgi:hypothetical protein